MSVEYLDKVLADTGSRVFAKFNRKEHVLLASLGYAESLTTNS